MTVTCINASARDGDLSLEFGFNTENHFRLVFVSSLLIPLPLTESFFCFSDQSKMTVLIKE